MVFRRRPSLPRIGKTGGRSACQGVRSASPSRSRSWSRRGPMRLPELLLARQAMPTAATAGRAGCNEAVSNGRSGPDDPPRLLGRILLRVEASEPPDPVTRTAARSAGSDCFGPTSKALMGTTSVRTAAPNRCPRSVDTRGRGDEMTMVALPQRRGRVCGYPGCATVLSIYNESLYCWVHESPHRATGPLQRRPSKPVRRLWGQM
jgi:hypothetical protein